MLVLKTMRNEKKGWPGMKSLRVRSMTARFALAVGAGLLVVVLSASAGAAGERRSPHLLFVSTGADRAERIHAPGSSPHAAAEDPCLPLLNSVREASPASAAAPSAPAAGRSPVRVAAALGVLLTGGQFALGPKESHRSARHDSAATDGRKAMAVVLYRQCRNDITVQALNGWR